MRLMETVANDDKAFLAPGQLLQALRCRAINMIRRAGVMVLLTAAFGGGELRSDVTERDRTPGASRCAPTGLPRAYAIAPPHHANHARAIR